MSDASGSRHNDHYPDFSGESSRSAPANFSQSEFQSAEDWPPHAADSNASESARTRSEFVVDNASESVRTQSEFYINASESSLIQSELDIASVRARYCF
jgi:hypothetical protein